MIGALLLQKIKKAGLYVLAIGLVIALIATVAVVGRHYVQNNAPPEKIVIKPTPQEMTGLKVESRDLGWRQVVGVPIMDDETRIMRLTFVIGPNPITDQQSWRVAYLQPPGDAGQGPGVYTQATIKDSSWWAWIVQQDITPSNCWTNQSTYFIRVTHGPPASNYTSWCNQPVH